MESSLSGASGHQNTQPCDSQNGTNPRNNLRDLVLNGIKLAEPKLKHAKHFVKAAKQWLLLAIQMQNPAKHFVK